MIPAEHEGLPVCAIGEGAFKNCKELTTVVIPESVTAIFNSAFEGCTNLTSVMIPYGVSSIGSEAFNLQLLGTDYDMTDPVRIAKGSGLVQLPLRERAGGSRHRCAGIAQHVMGYLQQKGGIYSAGKCDSEAALCLQISFQFFQLFVHGNRLSLLGGRHSLCIAGKPC